MSRDLVCPVCEIFYYEVRILLMIKKFYTGKTRIGVQVLEQRRCRCPTVKHYTAIHLSAMESGTGASLTFNPEDAKYWP